MRYLISITLLFSFFTNAADGTEKNSALLTLPQAIERALAQNPSIAAAYHDKKAALARPSQAATPPDPTFMVDFLQVPTNTADIGQGPIQYMVEQQVPFPSKLVYGYKAEKHAAESKQSREEVTAQEIVRRVKEAYFEVWRLQEEERINRRTLAVYNQNKGVSETAYATLKNPIADPVRASVNLGEIEAQLAIVEQERLQALANLSSMIAEPMETTIRVAPPPALPAVASLNELVDKAKAGRPEIAEAHHMVESESAKLSLAKSQYGPDLTLRWGFIDMPGNQQNAWYGRAGISIPLWSLSKQRFAVRESQAMLKRAESMSQETQLNTEAEVKSTYARLMAAKKVIKIYSGSVIPRARLLLSSSQEAYRSKQGDFLGVVDSIRSLNNAEIMFVRAKTDEAKAMAELERAVGASIEREGVK